MLKSILTLIFEILERIIIRDKIDYCMHCIIKTCRMNYGGVSYKDMKKTIGKFFNEETFDCAWNTAKWFKHILKRSDIRTDKYVYAASNEVKYDYDWLLYPIKRY